MTCYTLYNKDRNPVGHICGKLGPRCADCGDLGGNLCDFPVGRNKTCDRSICDFHSHETGPNLHYCRAHFAEWTAFRAAGGVPAELENVVPFAQKESR